jgi:hypothetical protein
MKPLLVLLLLSISCLGIKGQLVYPDSSINKLRLLADSLHLREMPGEGGGPNGEAGTYYSLPQGRMWKIEFTSPTDNLSEVVSDLYANKSLSFLLEKYRGLILTVDTTLFAVKVKGRYLTGTPEKGYDPEGWMTVQLVPGRWDYRYFPKDQFRTDHSVVAYQIPEALSQQALLAEYARYINFVDRVVDTGARVSYGIGFGLCSEDETPVLNALRAAREAADAGNWSVFIRAHLDLLNDRFLRMSDNSEVAGKRKTYINELEAIGLDVPDLVIGLSLRGGNVWRLGRAMTESKDRVLFEQKIQAMIGDRRLDEFNRGMLTILVNSLYRA